MDRANLNLDGREYVVLPREEFERLSALAKLPPLPRANKRGEVAAVAFGRASLARKIMRTRIDAGLTQKELASKAGIRVETLCRIEAGKHTATPATVQKIERALRAKG
ncbi:MAG TPA: helix-turn-helix transcriptional regulator [Phycisphaerales bacterium]|nr:helix-turn-helix transcriptional regulator [Phycisphaerales bacterium]